MKKKKSGRRTRFDDMFRNKGLVDTADKVGENVHAYWLNIRYDFEPRIKKAEINERIRELKKNSNKLAFEMGITNKAKRTKIVNERIADVLDKRLLDGLEEYEEARKNNEILPLGLEPVRADKVIADMTRFRAVVLERVYKTMFGKKEADRLLDRLSVKVRAKFKELGVISDELLEYKKK